MNTIETIAKTKSSTIERNRKLIKTFKELNNVYYNLFVRIYRGALVHALQGYSYAWRFLILYIHTPLRSLCKLLKQ